MANQNQEFSDSAKPNQLFHSIPAQGVAEDAYRKALSEITSYQYEMQQHNGEERALGSANFAKDGLQELGAITGKNDYAVVDFTKALLADSVVATQLIEPKIDRAKSSMDNISGDAVGLLSTLLSTELVKLVLKDVPAPARAAAALSTGLVAGGFANNFGACRDITDFTGFEYNSLMTGMVSGMGILRATTNVVPGSLIERSFESAFMPATVFTGLLGLSATAATHRYNDIASSWSLALKDADNLSRKNR